MRRVVSFTQIAGLFLFAIAALTLPQTGYAQNQVVYVNAPTVNLRNGAGEEYGVLKIVRSGAPLRVLNQQATWYQVKLTDGVIGWIAKSAVSAEKPQGALIEELKAQLSKKEAALSTTKAQLDNQMKINAQLESQLHDARQSTEGLNTRIQQLERGELLKLAAIGVLILLLGCLFGFLIGFFKRQAEDKRFIKMMVEAESVRKKIPKNNV